MIEKSISGRPISAEKAQLRRRNLYNLLKFAFRLITKTKYEGVENIPSQGPFIMATNHISRLDTPVLFLNPVRPDITALVTTKYMDYPFMRWFVETGGGIWLDRTKADFSAFGQAAEILAQGRPLGIAPEGTRSTNSQLLEAKPGAVLLAHSLNARAEPVATVSLYNPTEYTGPILVEVPTGAVAAPGLLDWGTTGLRAGEEEIPFGIREGKAHR